jgi:hypothetical protein
LIASDESIKAIAANKKHSTFLESFREQDCKRKKIQKAREYSFS